MFSQVSFKRSEINNGCDGETPPFCEFAVMRRCMDTGEAGGTGTIQEGKAARYALAALMKKYDAGEKGH